VNEVKSGVVTFLTMSYILLVNPQILGAAGGVYIRFLSGSELFFLL
jgi:xanthine/uracil/vitamin C permease (AzgA family)